MHADEYTWSVRQNAFDPETNKAYEGLFALGWESLQMRGCLSESIESAPQNLIYDRKPGNVTAETFQESISKLGTYVPGIYGDHPTLNTELINLPWMLGLDLIAEKERLSVESDSLTSFERAIDLRSGMLSRHSAHNLSSGTTIHRNEERFVHPAGVAIQRTTITSDHDITLHVRLAIDATVTTNGHNHFRSTNATFLPTSITCVIETDNDQTIECMLAWTNLEGTSVCAHEHNHESVASVRIKGGAKHIIEQRAAVALQKDQPTARVKSLATKSFEELREENAEAWRAQWEQCDVVIEGDASSQLALRVSLYHLIRAHPGEHADLAIDAKGYAGEAYWGRFFWDTEMYLLPFYLYTAPERARGLMNFRLQSLDGAKRNARRSGYTGARYAWESAPSGDECCPNWQYADHEIHITADVVYGLAHMYRALEPHTDWQKNSASDLLIETGRYWLERVDQRHGDNYLSLLGVMGPDEYTPISSNNSYTNALAAFALEQSAIAARSKGDRSLADRFAECARGLVIPRREDGLVLQCEEFERLAEPDFQRRWPERRGPFAGAVPQEVLYRTRCLKQADVLMLMALFPERFSDQEVHRAWEEYVPYTTHDSSLSAGMHMLCAQRLGMPQAAWSFWLDGCDKDLRVEEGGAAEGVHIAGCGATWMMAVFGFGGMKTAMSAEMLTIDPDLPSSWQTLSFPVLWHNQRAHVHVQRTNGEQTVRIRNHSEQPLRVRCWDRTATIDPAAEIEFAERDKP